MNTSAGPSSQLWLPAQTAARCRGSMPSCPGAAFPSHTFHPCSCPVTCLVVPSLTMSWGTSLVGQNKAVPTTSSGLHGWGCLDHSTCWPQPCWPNPVKKSFRLWTLSSVCPLFGDTLVKPISSSTMAPIMIIFQCKSMGILEVLSHLAGFFKVC